MNIYKMCRMECFDFTWNFYLNWLNYYIKSELKVRYYGRYIDDMIFLLNSKSELYSIAKKRKKILINIK